MGLQVEEEKAEHMEIRRHLDGTQTDEFLKVGSFSFKLVSELKYIGTMIIQSNKILKIYNNQD